MKIIYAGSPEGAKKTLEILYNRQNEIGFEIAGVLSNPPTAKGRHKELTPTPVAAFALEKGLSVFTPEHLDSAARDSISPLGADLLVCFAYGHIFGPKFLKLFPMGGINLHPSLLPKYRGCTPVNAAILNRDSETAATIQTLSLKMDEGEILAQKIIPLDGTETAESLLNESAEEGASLICDLLTECIKNGKLPSGRVQSGEASYTGIISKDYGKIDWSMDVSLIEAKIRAYYPDPGCWCMEKGLSLKITKAAYIPCGDTRIAELISSDDYEKAPCGKVLQLCKAEGIYVKGVNGVLVLKELQRQGKKVMNYKDFLNGARDFIGSVLE